MYGKPVQDEQQGAQSDQRLTLLEQSDLSSMVSHTDCWDERKLQHRPADYRRRVLHAWCLWQACWNLTVLQVSSWTWSSSRSTILPWQRSCRIIWRQDLKRGMKTFCQHWETLPGGFTNASCIWVLVYKTGYSFYVAVHKPQLLPHGIKYL
jgi:hypothetical protein